MRALLEVKTMKELKKMISDTNIKGYSKLNKKQIIDKMMKEEKRFMDYVIQSHKKQQREKASKQTKPLVKKEKKPKKKIETHKMPDGTIHTGKTHTSKSKPVETKKEEPKKEKKPSKKSEITKQLKKILKPEQYKYKHEFFNERENTEQVENMNMNNLFTKEDGKWELHYFGELLTEEQKNKIHKAVGYKIVIKHIDIKERIQRYEKQYKNSKMYIGDSKTPVKLETKKKEEPKEEKTKEELKINKVLKEEKPKEKEVSGFVKKVNKILEENKGKSVEDLIEVLRLRMTPSERKKLLRESKSEIIQKIKNSEVLKTKLLEVRRKNPRQINRR